jgi:hypothetical protein
MRVVFNSVFKIHWSTGPMHHIQSIGSSYDLLWSLMISYAHQNAL